MEHRLFDYKDRCSFSYSLIGICIVWFGRFIVVCHIVCGIFHTIGHIFDTIGYAVGLLLDNTLIMMMFITHLLMLLVERKKQLVLE